MSLHKPDLERSSSVTSESNCSVSNSADHDYENQELPYSTGLKSKAKSYLRAYLRRTIGKITRWLWVHGHVLRRSQTHSKLEVLLGHPIVSMLAHMYSIYQKKEPVKFRAELQ
jgi:hypothetical protein